MATWIPLYTLRRCLKQSRYETVQRLPARSWVDSFSMVDERLVKFRFGSIAASRPHPRRTSEPRLSCRKPHVRFVSPAPAGAANPARLTTTTPQPYDAPDSACPKRACQPGPLTWRRWASKRER